MTPAEEHQLYLSDYPAWVKYIAPNCIKRARERPDLKAQMWQWSGELLRNEIRRLVG